ncbi:MAG: DNA polymerase III subunit delta [Saprospiraceae bacterium]|nr:MAG: DNA polymerase III subunit delta [Saprospiraceae bacterium]
MTFEQILSDLNKKQFKPIYFLHGKESYFIDAISDKIENSVLTEGERSFNQTIIYGKDSDHLMVVDNARRYPMMSSLQVVILKEAQEMRSLKDLKTYIEKPMQTTVLVICHKHKKLNLNSGFGKALKANAVIFESKPLYDNQVGAWIAKYLQSKKLKIQPNAAELVAEYLGTDLSKVVNELEKLAINLPVGTEVTDKHIEEHIGISKDYNVFELQKALAQRNVVKANRIVNYFTANARKHPLPVLIGSLYNYFSKIYMLQFLRNASERDQLSALKLNSPFFLKEYRLALKNYNRVHTEKALNVLKEFDLKSKGVDYISTGKPEGELLKEMVWLILH